MKIIIAGGREFELWHIAVERLDYFLQNVNDIEIVSGRCSEGIRTFVTDDGIDVFGADGLGERYAKDRGFKVTPFPADWDKYGTAAGPIRNRQMAEYADALICFWDGKSRGTGNMIKEAEKKGLRVKTVRF